MLRAYFMLRLRNIDGFYYLRRRHKAALTVAPDLGESSLRRINADVDYAVYEWIR